MARLWNYSAKKVLFYLAPLIALCSYFRLTLDLGNSLWQLRNEFTDTTIICQNGQSALKAHKIVLAARSSVLRDVLHKSDTLLLPGMSQSDLESALESIYKADSKSVVRMSQIETMLSPLSDIDMASLSLNQPKSPLSIDSLPTEMLCKILSYVPTMDLRGNVAFVSKKFNNVTKSPYTHKAVTLYFPINKYYYSFLRNATQMTEFHFESFVNDDINKLLSSFADHSCLQFLKITSDIYVDNDTFRILRQSKWWTSLKYFDVQIADDYYTKNLERLPEFILAFQELGSKGNLRHFGFGCKYEDINLPTVLALINSPNLNQLQSLTIYDPLDEATTEAFVRRKDTLRELRILNHFHYIETTPMNFLAHFPNLVVLEINQPFKDLKILPQLSNLQHLLLRQILVTLTTFKLPPSCLPKLTFLDVSSTNPNDDEYSICQWSVQPLPNQVFFFVFKGSLIRRVHK